MYAYVGSKKVRIFDDMCVLYFCFEKHPQPHSELKKWCPFCGLWSHLPNRFYLVISPFSISLPFSLVISWNIQIDLIISHETLKNTRYIKCYICLTAIWSLTGTQTKLWKAGNSRQQLTCRCQSTSNLVSSKSGFLRKQIHISYVFILYIYVIYIYIYISQYIYIYIYIS